MKRRLRHGVCVSNAHEQVLSATDSEVLDPRHSTRNVSFEVPALDALSTNLTVCQSSYHVVDTVRVLVWVEPVSTTAMGVVVDSTSALRFVHLLLDLIRYLELVVSQWS